MSKSSFHVIGYPKVKVRCQFENFPGVSWITMEFDPHSRGNRVNGVMSWLFLIGAIVFEVAGTLSLRMVSTGKRLWWIAVAAGYITAFTMLIFTLDNGMALGVAYGIWAASGVALTAILSKLIFKEQLTLVMSIGILVVIGGVLMIELGSGAIH
jgi:small multidrug resistance pump